ncbi:MAG TPA: hypothetical protein VFN42_02085, partial [Acetobacteraceae bacterium]|nr:hypothetical protein [Acetobacteraceae bacterium]
MPVSTQSFTDQAVQGLDFSGGTITETDTGAGVESFSGGTLVPQLSTFGLGPFHGISWGSFSAGVIAPGATLSVAIEYTVSDTNAGGLLAGLEQSFTGSGTAGSALTIQESVYSDAAHSNLVGQITTNLSHKSSPSYSTGDVVLTNAYQTLYVDVQVTATVDPLAAPGSQVTFSMLRQGFGQAGVTLDKQVSTDGTTWLEVGNGNFSNEPVVSAGSAVYERVLVVNSGSVAISNAQVTDAGGSGPTGFTFGGSAATGIAIGQTITSDIATLTAVTGEQLDTATVTGTVAFGGRNVTVSANDQADYFATGTSGQGAA